MNLFLFIIGLFLSALFMPFGFAYSFIRLMIHANIGTWLRRINQYFFVGAVAIDQLGNVMMQELFNDIIIKRGGHQFGNEDETISSVLGKNKLTGHLTLLGRIISALLNLLDYHHVEKSIEADEK